MHVFSLSPSVCCSHSRFFLNFFFSFGKSPKVTIKTLTLCLDWWVQYCRERKCSGLGYHTRLWTHFSSLLSPRPLSRVFCSLPIAKLSAVSSVQWFLLRSFFCFLHFFAKLLYGISVFLFEFFVWVCMLLCRVFNPILGSIYDAQLVFSAFPFKQFHFSMSVFVMNGPRISLFFSQGKWKECWTLFSPAKHLSLFYTNHKNWKAPFLLNIFRSFSNSLN